MDKAKDMWDKRYSEEEYVYGTQANEFFKEAIERHNLSGDILLAAEGEGRNAVYAAKKGLRVTAFDISIEGKKKALRLAEKENVKMDYEVGNFFDLGVMKKTYDSAALIYAHFPPPLLTTYHKKIAELIKPGGMVLLEGFSKGHAELKKANPQLGGPDKIEMLFSKESIKQDFPDFEIIQLEELEITLHEGSFHNGISKVIRFIGIKKDTTS